MTTVRLSGNHNATGRSVAGLALHQFRFDLRAMLRNRQAQFFTLALPVAS